MCGELSTQLQTCGFTDWERFGADGPQQFARACRGDWDDVVDDLTSVERGEALEVCRDTRAALLDVSQDTGQLNCEELLRLYAPK